MEPVGLEVVLNLRELFEAGMLSNKVGVVGEDGCFESCDIFQKFEDVEICKRDVLSSEEFLTLQKEFQFGEVLVGNLSEELFTLGVEFFFVSEENLKESI